MNRVKKTNPMKKTNSIKLSINTEMMGCSDLWWCKLSKWDNQLAWLPSNFLCSKTICVQRLVTKDLKRISKTVNVQKQYMKVAFYLLTIFCYISMYIWRGLLMC